MNHNDTPVGDTVSSNGRPVPSSAASCMLRSDSPGRAGHPRPSLRVCSAGIGRLGIDQPDWRCSAEHLSRRRQRRRTASGGAVRRFLRQPRSGRPMVGGEPWASITCVTRRPSRGPLQGGAIGGPRHTCSSIRPLLPTNRNCSSELPLSSAAYLDLVGARRLPYRYDARVHSMFLLQAD
jgi:hypothetical protein